MYYGRTKDIKISLYMKTFFWISQNDYAFIVKCTIIHVRDWVYKGHVRIIYFWKNILSDIFLKNFESLIWKCIISNILVILLSRTLKIYYFIRIYNIFLKLLSNYKACLNFQKRKVTLLLAWWASSRNLADD